MSRLDDLDKKIIWHLSGDIPESREPFALLAGRMGIDEQDLLKRIEGFKADGTMRRFGSVLVHQAAGFEANGMAVWVVPEDRVQEVGRAMASFAEVSHCYERPTYPTWKYNLYTMIHGKTEEDCLRVAEEISKKVGIADYRVLFSTREFKKTSMRYFGP